jgi:ferredoxin like protein
MAATETEQKKGGVEDKLYKDRFVADEERSHLKIIDPEVCRTRCKDKPCTNFCPAAVYKCEDGEIRVDYLGCLECGTCRVGCPYANIEWEYPKGGFGVQYKFG